MNLTIKQIKKMLIAAQPQLAKIDISNEVARAVWNSCTEVERQDMMQGGKQDVGHYLMMADGNERLSRFLDVCESMTDKDYWKYLRLVWCNIEVSFQDRRLWLRLFESERPNRQCLMGKTEHSALASMPETLTVFRGYLGGKAKNGLSWTLSEERARWFAAEYANGLRRAMYTGFANDQPPMVVSGQCFKRDVLAYFDDRSESEIVIRPEKVFSKKAVQVTKESADQDVHPDSPQAPRGKAVKNVRRKRSK